MDRIGIMPDLYSRFLSAIFGFWDDHIVGFWHDHPLLHTAFAWAAIFGFITIVALLTGIVGFVIWPGLIVAFVLSYFYGSELPFLGLVLVGTNAAIGFCLGAFFHLVRGSHKEQD